MLLAFDTSTAACTAALFDDDGICVGSKNEVIGRGHAERLMPMLAELLGKRRADRILVGVGPGSFTGIRVGIAAGLLLTIGTFLFLFGAASPEVLAESGAKMILDDHPLWFLLLAVVAVFGMVFQFSVNRNYEIERYDRWKEYTSG